MNLKTYSKQEYHFYTINIYYCRQYIFLYIGKANKNMFKIEKLQTVKENWASDIFFYSIPNFILFRNILRLRLSFIELGACFYIHMCMPCHVFCSTGLLQNN